MKVIENAVAGGESKRSCGLLQLSERQVQRLKRRYVQIVAWVYHGMWTHGCDL